MAKNKEWIATGLAKATVAPGQWVPYVPVQYSYLSAQDLSSTTEPSNGDSGLREAAKKVVEWYLEHEGDEFFDQDTQDLFEYLRDATGKDDVVEVAAIQKAAATGEPYAGHHYGPMSTDMAAAKYLEMKKAESPVVSWHEPVLPPSTAKSYDIKCPKCGLYGGLWWSDDGTDLNCGCCGIVGPTCQPPPKCDTGKKLKEGEDKVPF